MFHRLLASQKRGPADWRTPFLLDICWIFTGGASKYPTIYIANRKTCYFIKRAVNIYMFAIKFNIFHHSSFNTVNLL